MFNELLQAHIEQAKKHPEYWQEKAKLDFSLELERCRKLAGLSYKDIAKALGTSPAYVSKVFRGDANLTIETMINLTRAVGARLNIQVTLDDSVWPNVRLLKKPQPIKTAQAGTIVNNDGYWLSDAHHIADAA